MFYYCTLLQEEILIDKLQFSQIVNIKIIYIHKRRLFMNKILSMCLTIICILSLAGCSGNTPSISLAQEKATGVAYLYGEQHGVQSILDKEFELWYEYYHQENMRHLFVELPFYGAEYLNLWMQSENDTILDEIFLDIKGTAMDTPQDRDFFIQIKSECPETIFHGIDVGHAYTTMGIRFLNHLSENNLQDTEQHLLTKEAIEQGENYYKKNNHEYRENMLVENFKREFDKLSNQDIMGIFGSAHIDLNGYVTQNTANMATQLIEYYGKNIITESLTYLAKEISSIRIDTLTISEKEYKAAYFGKQDLSQISSDFSHREFWKLNDAFEDFTTAKTTGNVLPLDNYPMNLELNHIYIVDYTKKDGSIIREVHRYDGYEWNGQQSTQQIDIN